MSQSKPQNPGSILLAEEYFAAEDSRFLDAIRNFHTPAALAGFVDRWKADPRPFARAQILAYLVRPFDSLGHNVVVKRIFKHAEKSGDDEVMRAMLVALDRSVRRVRKTRQRYDWQTREIWTEERLAPPRDMLPREATVKRTDWRGREYTVQLPIPRNGRLFSHRTRGHLRRRAWRYFRLLGFQHFERYLTAVTWALQQYQDDDLAKGENILDNWGLMQICFRRHAVLEFTTSQIRLKQGSSISDLTPAPQFPHIWKTAEAAWSLEAIVSQAQSRLVRLWAMDLLRQDHAARLAEIPLDTILKLLEHADEEVQQFAATILEASRDLGHLPVNAWFNLLKTRNELALDAICRAMQKHIAAERLTLDDCIRLACEAPVPVARLGLAYLKARSISSADDRRQLTAVAEARCSATAGELTAWVLPLVAGRDTYDRDSLLRFLDSRTAPIRQAAWQWLIAENSGEHDADSENRSPGYSDAVLWCRLLESPYDDLKLPLIDELARRSSLPGAGAKDLAPLWCSVLLGVHRGGRQKVKATHQIARKLADDPSQAEKLLPVLVVAVRSIRPAEARAGLAAVMSAVAARPELAATVREQLPELSWEAT